MNDVIVDAGGINAAAQLQGWQKITDEEIVKLNPDVIIDADDDKGFIQKILAHLKQNGIRVSAVKNHPRVQRQGILICRASHNTLPKGLRM